MEEPAARILQNKVEEIAKPYWDKITTLLIKLMTEVVNIKDELRPD